MPNWNDSAKRILKSELIKRGVTNSELVLLLRKIGVIETKASIDSKISRGSFSAIFLLQCLTVIGCHKIEIDGLSTLITISMKQNDIYKNKQNEKQ